MILKKDFWKFNPNLVYNSACCELLTTEYASRVEEFKVVQDKRVFERIPKSGKNIMFKIKPLKNVQNIKKQLFFDSKVNELISNENNDKFWDTLKSMNENNLSYNNNENQTNKL